MTAQPNGPDLSKWLTDAEACARLGYQASKTLDRARDAGRLHPEFRPRAGNRPQRVWDPEEIAAQIKPHVSVLPAVQTPVQTPVQTIPTGTSGPSVPPIRPEDADRVIARLVEMVVEARRAPKLWASLKEAADEVGLSRRFLYRLVKSGRLDAVRDGKLMVRREDLEDLDVESELVRPKKRAAKR